MRQVDSYDTIDWLIKNISNNNGKVGVFGISLSRLYSTEAALCNHPALVAVSPQAPVTDWFVGDDWHHNGALMIMDAFSFYGFMGFGNPRPQPTKEGFRSKIRTTTKDGYAYHLRTGAVPNFTKLIGDSVEFWEQAMNHPNYDAWWKGKKCQNRLLQCQTGDAGSGRFI